MNRVHFVFAFLKKDLLEELSYRSNFALHFLGIVPVCFLYYYLAQIVDTADLRYRAYFGGEYFFYLLLGMGLFQFAHIGLESFVRAVREEAVGGTLEAIWLGVSSPLTLIAAMGAWPFLRGLLTLGILVGVGGIVSPSIFEKLPVTTFLISLLLSFFLYASLGLLAVSVSLVTKRGEMLVSFFNTLNFILAGVLIPPALFPPWLRLFSEFLPLTHLLRLVRGESESSFLFPLLFGVISYGAGVACFTQAVRRVQVEGSLSHF